MPGRDAGTADEGATLSGPRRVVRAAGGRLRRHWPVLRALAGAGILAALVARLGTGAFVDGLRAVDAPAMLVALGIGLLITVFSAWRWCIVARGLGLRLSPTVAVADCYRASFLNSVLPAGVLGDVHRAVSHGRQAGDGRGVRAVALERCAGMVVVVVVGVAVLLAHPSLLGAVFGSLVPHRGLAVAVIVMSVAVLALGAWSARVPRVRGALRTGLADVRSSVVARGTWPGVVLMSVAVMACHLALLVVAARAAGSQAALAELLPLLVLVLLVMGLPISIGGWGPREAVSTVAFGAVGYGATQGFTVAVAYGVLSLVACLPGLGVLLLRRTPPRFVAVPAPAVAVARC